jgi:hypothetical protein
MEVEHSGCNAMQWEMGTRSVELCWDLEIDERSEDFNGIAV